MGGDRKVSIVDSTSVQPTTTIALDKHGHQVFFLSCPVFSFTCEALFFLLLLLLLLFFFSFAFQVPFCDFTRTDLTSHTKTSQITLFQNPPKKIKQTNSQPWTTVTGISRLRGANYSSHTSTSSSQDTPKPAPSLHRRHHFNNNPRQQQPHQRAPSSAQPKSQTRRNSPSSSSSTSQRGSS